MGVQGLWELLTPVGRRVSVDALGSRKLAVDASIWIIQFMKAMRDDKGDMIRNAHLLGFFRRICKLLYLRIKPVFVFDGATPALKRRTVLARRRQRENAQSKIRKTAEKLLLNHLRSRKLEEIAAEMSAQTPSTKAKGAGDGESTAERLSKADAGAAVSVPSSTTSKHDQETTDALLAATLAKEYGGKKQGSDAGDDEDEEEDDDAEEELILPAANGLDPSVLASLPPSMQLDLLVQMREQLVAENRQKFQKVAKAPSSFSQMQIQAYLKTVAFRREINEVQKAAAGGGIGGVPTVRVASTFDREFVFSKSFEGEKPAPSEIEEQRRSEMATPQKDTPPASNLPPSLRKPSSVLFSSLSQPQERASSATTPQEEDGVVSLVSTQLNNNSNDNDQQVTTDSTSVVHTYVDERGNVRVNRRRGMGVRMTRDLQWNLYLMKDSEARRLEESPEGFLSGPPIIPSSAIHHPAAAATVPGLAPAPGPRTEGLQISFVDDGGSELSKDEDGDLFEELVMDKEESKAPTDHQASLGTASVAQQGPYVQQGRVEVAAGDLDAGVINGEDGEDDEDDGVEWEEGGIHENGDGTVVEDRDLAEAMRLSLQGHAQQQQSFPEPDQRQPAAAGGGGAEDSGGELSNQILLEDGSSSEESEVEWEDGTGDMSVADLEEDGATNEEGVTEATMMSSEEAAAVEEAIRRSLEDFCPPVRPSAQLVIKEPAPVASVVHNSKMHEPLKGPLQSKQQQQQQAPLERTEAESEEVYLARERTRKGKAVLGGDQNGYPAAAAAAVYPVPSRLNPVISEQEQIAAITLSEIPVIESTTVQPQLQLQPQAQAQAQPQPTQALPQNLSHPLGLKREEVTGVNNGAVPTFIPKAMSEQRVRAGVDVPTENALKSSKPDVSEFMARPFVQPEELVEKKGSESVTRKIPTLIPTPTALEERQENGQKEDASSLPPLREQDTARDKVGFSYGGMAEGQPVDRWSLPSRPPAANVYHKDAAAAAEEEEALLREAEQFDVDKEQREEFQNNEAVLNAEMDRLAEEEANLQEELEMEREGIKAGLEREREILANEELELRANQKKYERNADSVTGEMFAEIQDLLQMFGLPYLIAPMEAEAQCAHLDTNELVDGVVTDDSDVFLFGGRTVYKNLFDDRKYVETYYMKDLESEMGMTREKLIRIAMLLGSDYTEGISGIGIVNAIEVVNAFSEEDGLQKFKEWLDAPDHALFEKAQGHPKGKGKGGGRRGKDKTDAAGMDVVLDGDGAGDVDESDEPKFTPLQQSFMGKHRAVSKNWNIPESFPSEAVVAAYVSPAVDKSKETFTWGRPDLEALRRFCYERFVWTKEKADELLLPVLKEYDRRETQTRLESFYHFNQRFAKIRSSRIQKAVTGMTGKRSAELMELPPHLIPTEGNAGKKPRKSSKKAPKSTNVAQEVSNNEAEDGNVEQTPPHDHDESEENVADPPHSGSGRGGRGGRGPRRGKQQQNGGRKRSKSDESPAGTVKQEEITDGGVRSGTGSGRERGKSGGQVSASCRPNGGRGRGRGRGRGAARGPAEEEEEPSCSSDSSDNADSMSGHLGGIHELQQQQQPRRSTRSRPQVTTYHVDNSSDEEAGGGTYSDGEEMLKEVDMLVAEATQRKKKTETAAAPFAMSSIDEQQQHVGTAATTTATAAVEDAYDEGVRSPRTTNVQAEVGGPSVSAPGEMNDSALGGGFCISEDGELSQHGIGMGMGINEPPTYFASGGGFCVSDEEEGGEPLGFPPGRDGDEVTERNGNNFSEGLNHQIIEPDPDTAELDRRSPGPVLDTSLNTSQNPGIDDESLEPTAALGLRAMPLMRRKKRKSP